MAIRKPKKVGGNLYGHTLTSLFRVEKILQKTDKETENRERTEKLNRDPTLPFCFSGRVVEITTR